MVATRSVALDQVPAPALAPPVPAARASSGRRPIAARKLPDSTLQVAQLDQNTSQVGESFGKILVVLHSRLERITAPRQVPPFNCPQAEIVPYSRLYHVRILALQPFYL